MDEIPLLGPSANHPLCNPPVVVEGDSDGHSFLWYARLDFGRRRASIVVLLLCNYYLITATQWLTAVAREHSKLSLRSVIATLQFALLRGNGSSNSPLLLGGRTVGNEISVCP